MPIIENKVNTILKTGRNNFALYDLKPSKANFFKENGTTWRFKFNNDYYVTERLYNGAVNNGIDINSDQILFFQESMAGTSGQAQWSPTNTINADSFNVGTWYSLNAGGGNIELEHLKYPSRFLIIGLRLKSAEYVIHTFMIPTALILKSVGDQIKYLNDNNITTWGDKTIPDEVVGTYRFYTAKPQSSYYDEIAHPTLNNAFAYLDVQFKYYSEVRSLGNATTQPTYYAGVKFSFKVTTINDTSTKYSLYYVIFR